jgi:hypothetical protein
MPRGDSYQLQGQQGGIVLTSTESATGTFRWIQAIEDTQLACSDGETAGNLASIDNLDAITIPAGVGIGGIFTKVVVTTGTAIVYYA